MRSTMPKAGRPRRPVRPLPQRVLMVTSECAPLAKTGGLGDAVAGLAKALRQAGCDVRVVLPFYAGIPRTTYRVTSEGAACVHMGGGAEHWIGVHRTALAPGLPVWLVEYERYFGRPGIYDGPGGEYTDNAFRFALLCEAALQICRDRAFYPQVVHVHDWPTALLAPLLRLREPQGTPLGGAATVLTIHNVAYQGIYDASVYPYLGFGPGHFTPDEFECYGKVNLLKAGVAWADALTTVSPGYAAEILTPAGGQGLAPYLVRRQADLVGILNGADYEHWNPATDPRIPARYSARAPGNKAACKRALQERLGLRPDPATPLIGAVSRLAAQKGLDWLRAFLPDLLNRLDFQFAALGTGDPALENYLRWISAAYPDRVACRIGFSEEWSHWIQAGSDFFLMPSRFEPCGLSQMYALRYGTLPIVRATGGLADTVQDYDPATGRGTGIVFQDPTPEALQAAIERAIALWHTRPARIARMRRAAMRLSFSWGHAARQYMAVYRRALRRRTNAG